MLWTDVIDPATLTGYIRESMSAYEARKGTLARFLPNREVSDIAVRFVAGQAGLVEEAKYRAYDAEIEVGKGPGGKRVILELPAVGRNIPVSEYAQLRGRNASEDAIRDAILRTAVAAVQGVADRVERMRGTVLVTGKATINQANYKTEDDFGRNAGLTATASTLWSAGGADPLGNLATWSDLQESLTGIQPGAMVMSRRVFRALAAHASMATMVGGTTRPATEAEVRALVASHGLPEIVIYDRRTSGGRVIPDDRLLLLPAPVGVDEGEASELGATFWGQTLTSQDSSYELADSEQPGVVAGVYRQPKPPMIAEVITDAISLPVLANADLSACFKVL